MWLLAKHCTCRKVHWVGTSMGGIIGMMLANAAPGLIHSLDDAERYRLPSFRRRDCSASCPYIGAKRHSTRAPKPKRQLRKNCATFGITEEAHWQDLFAHSIQPRRTANSASPTIPAIASRFPKTEDIKDVDLWPYFEMLAIPVLLTCARRQIRYFAARSRAAKCKPCIYASRNHEIAGLPAMRRR